MHRPFPLAVLGLAIASACHGAHPVADPVADPAAHPAAAPATGAGDPAAGDYAEARKRFRTKLVRHGASPQQAPPLTLPADAHELAYRSGALELRAWMSSPTGERQPAVVFVHGGSAFGVEDWDQTRPFRDAGFVVMTPILRAENGSPGDYSLFYDEVDDVIAAADTLARQPGVDPSRIFVAGHSNGGAITLLAAMASTRFRAAAALSGLTDASGLRGDPEMVPFDQTDPEERRMRSAVAFPGSFKCPTRVYYGDRETGQQYFEELAQRARAAGRDVAAVRVPGDHHAMAAAAIPLAIELFRTAR